MIIATPAGSGSRQHQHAERHQNYFNGRAVQGRQGPLTKCPPKAPAKTVRCKSANGKFAKCGTAGVKPV
jgi:hypothetical protein